MVNKESKTSEQRAVEVIAEVGNKEPESCTPGASLIGDLDFDSLDMVELTMAIEEEFDIEIPDEAAEKWKTVEDVTGYVAKHVPAGPIIA